jgi:predicted Zn-dependent protease
MIAPGVVTQASSVVLESGEVRRLVSIGFHGVFNGKPKAALRLFEALSVIRPNEGFPRIGRALALLAMGRAEEAVRVLEETSSCRPDDDDVRVYLGMALRLANRGRQSDAVLASVAERPGDSARTRLAQQLLKLSL